MLITLFLLYLKYPATDVKNRPTAFLTEFGS